MIRHLITIAIVMAGTTAAMAQLIGEKGAHACQSRDATQALARAAKANNENALAALKEYCISIVGMRYHVIAVDQPSGSRMALAKIRLEGMERGVHPAIFAPHQAANPPIRRTMQPGVPVFRTRMELLRFMLAWARDENIQSYDCYEGTGKAYEIASSEDIEDDEFGVATIKVFVDNRQYATGFTLAKLVL